eukprot:5455322-Alexandrium_andersonii.AAC.1
MGWPSGPVHDAAAQQVALGDFLGLVLHAAGHIRVVDADEAEDVGLGSLREAVVVAEVPTNGPGPELCERGVGTLGSEVEEADGEVADGALL